MCEGATFLQYHAAMGNVWLLNIDPKTKHKQLIHIEANGMASLYQIKMSPLWLNIARGTTDPEIDSET